MKTLVIAGTHSGVGKTSLSIGLMSALTRRGHKIQPYKVGPDFIDPTHHSRACGRQARNLDGWMLSREANLSLFHRAAQGTDIAMIEGCMGLFDGYDGKTENGSTAQMAKWLGAPVILVVDASAMSRSAAALLHGFRTFDPDLNVAGVVFNKIAGDSHLNWLREAVGTFSPLPIIGGLPRNAEIEIPERHLGLWMSHETGSANPSLEKLADLCAQHLDLTLLENLSSKTVTPPPPSPVNSFSPSLPPVRMAVARDEAFCFFYEDNLDALREAGAELIPFSPLRDVLPDGIQAIYFGGGYPELHVRELAANRNLLQQVRNFSEKNGVIYAECGGLMYLGKSLTDGSDKTFEMAGVFPFATRMQKRARLAYCEVTMAQDNTLFTPGLQARGHLFHYSEIQNESDCGRVYTLKAHGQVQPEGYQVRRTLASYVHLHFGSQPELAHALIRSSR